MNIKTGGEKIKRTIKTRRRPKAYRNKFTWGPNDRVLITGTNGVTRESDTGRIIKNKED
jgi:hypothetical protein